MLTELKDGLEAISMKHHVGTKIVCPVCEVVMDCADAVEVTVVDTKSMKHHFCRVCCASCADKMNLVGTTREVVKKVAAETGTDLTVTVVDGRTVDWSMANMMEGL